MEIYYTGIGSRSTPDNILRTFYNLAVQLSKLGLILRSGGAEGADKSFEIGCDSEVGRKEIYLPWKGFNNSSSSLYTISEKGRKLAEGIHPYWYNLSEPAKKLQIRNCYQVLGYDLNNPSKFVVCWTENGKGSGGSGQAIRLAKYLNIPTFDFGNVNAEKDLTNYIQEIFNKSL